MAGRSECFCLYMTTVYGCDGEGIMVVSILFRKENNDSSRVNTAVNL